MQFWIKLKWSVERRFYFQFFKLIQTTHSYTHTTVSHSQVRESIQVDGNSVNLPLLINSFKIKRKALSCFFGVVKDFCDEFQKLNTKKCIFKFSVV